MNNKKTTNEKISEALNVEYDSDEPIVKKEDNLPVVQKETNKDLPTDYDEVRGNLKDLIDTGKSAIDGILNVALNSDSPRAYEVAAQMIKTVSEANKDLIGLHKQMKDINKEEVTINTNTTNALYVGSTSDLQDLINQSRSAKKVFTQKYNDIIDVEAEEVDDD